MSVIETHHISKIYNPDSDIELKALNDVNLAIEEGEFTAIVGPSGSGKTTLLNIIGGLDNPSDGQVMIAGTEITNMKESQLLDFRLRNIGFVFQAYNLIPVLTASENVGYVMMMQKRPKGETDQRVKELLMEVGLGDKMNKRPGHLSGGQQQRVAVARALASKPKFILADEPTANLDSKSTADLLDIMLKLNKEEGSTFVFSTHDQRVIDRARRVITLEDGKIVSDERRNPED